MSPLKVEVFNPNKNEWFYLPDVNRGNSNVGMTANNSDGSRDAYLFEFDKINRQCNILKSWGGPDVPHVTSRIADRLGFIAVANLKDSESFEFETFTDIINGLRSKIIFTYIDD